MMCQQGITRICKSSEAEYSLTLQAGQAGWDIRGVRYDTQQELTDLVHEVDGRGVLLGGEVVAL